MRDPRVDAFIDALPDWQRRLCQDLRHLIHAADPDRLITGGHEHKTARTVAGG